MTKEELMAWFQALLLNPNTTAEQFKTILITAFLANISTKTVDELTQLKSSLNAKGIN